MAGCQPARVNFAISQPASICRFLPNFKVKWRMPSLHIYLFGSPRVEHDGNPIIIRRRKTIALLAYLATTGHPHSRESLAALLWSENDSASARANLRRDLSRLKKTLGQHHLAIERAQAGMAIQKMDEAGDWWLDVAAFQAHVGLLRDHDHFPEQACAACLTASQEAVALYKSDFMSGFTLPDSPAYDEWQFFQAESLRQALADILQRLTIWHSSQAEYARGIEYGRRWLALDNLYEAAHQQLMRLYAWDGQYAAALRQYDECVRILEEELGVKPQPQTEAVLQSIRTRQLDPPLSIQDKLEREVDAPGELLISERYQVGELLAEGGQGKVFLGIDRVSGQKVVIKQLKADISTAQADNRVRFQRESEILHSLDHPNIVRLLANFDHNGRSYIVMEYVPGGSLRQLLQSETGLTLPQTLRLGLELADALSRAHHLGVIHRDIKPGNVLLAADGTPRLTDFGIAYLESGGARLTQTGMLVGSPAYMSPEAIQGDKIDARSDIWSLGVLLYETLTGVSPFGADQVTTMLVKILHEQPPEIQAFRSDVPAALSRLINQMLAKDPARRVGSMRQIAAALEAIRDGRFAAVNITQTSFLPPLINSDTTAVHTATPHNLTTISSPIIGRETELDQIQRLIMNEKACRLLTISGPGGIGKTRLVYEAGKQLLPLFPDGVYFVSLTAVKRTNAIISVIAETLDLQFYGASTPKTQLLHFLHSKSMLLILDNFEQLLDAADLLAEMLRFAPDLIIMTTSRERLQLQEEWHYKIEGLAFPVETQISDMAALETYAAPALFLQLVRRTNVSFEFSHTDIPAIMEICRLLEGSPLGLELAAPWVQTLACTQVAAEIKRNLDAFTIAPPPGIPREQFSLRAVFTQTWHNLQPAEQVTLVGFSVFRGGCLRAAAEFVAAASTPVLTALVGKGLLRRASNGRYTIQDLIREFVTEKLEQQPEEFAVVQAKHSEFYLGLLANLTQEIKGGQQTAVLNAITADDNNIYAAWQHAVAQNQISLLLAAAECYWLFSEFNCVLYAGEAMFRDAITGLTAFDADDSMAQTLFGFLQAGEGSLMARRGWLVEGVDKMEAGIHSMRQAPVTDSNKIAFAQTWLAAAQVIQGQYAAAIKNAQKSLAHFPQNNDYWTKAVCLRLLGTIAVHQGDLTAAEQYLNECLTACDQIGEQRIQTYARINLGTIALLSGDYGRCRQRLGEAQALNRQVADRLSRVELLREQGKLAVQQGYYDQARSYLEESQRIAIEVGHSDSGEIACALGVIYERLGNLEQARALFHESLAVAKAVGNQARIADSMLHMARLANDSGQIDQAEQLLQDALFIWRQIGNELLVAAGASHLGHVIASNDEARQDEARQHFRTALEIAVKHDLLPIAMQTMTYLAPLLVNHGQQNWARDLLFLAEQHPGSAYFTRQSARQQLVVFSEVDSIDSAVSDRLIDWRAACQRLIIELQKPVRASGTISTNLPRHTSAFIGREQELVDLKQCLIQDKCRLLTLVGPGGIGKTRLALAVAAEVKNLKHGIHYISLASIESADDLLTAVAEGLEFQISPVGAPQQQLVEFLKPRQLLIILDNYEHLLPDVTFVAALFANAPHVQIMVTSRQRLNLGGEVIYALAGMPYPHTIDLAPNGLYAYGAVKLLLTQVRMNQPDFELRPEDSAALLQICRLVQGMPLALVLAAGWADMLTFSEIAEEITRSLDFLESERHDLPPRQRSVRAVFDGSWERMTAENQLVFAQLSVFRGGFTRQSAYVVANANLRTLRKLVNSSLITIRENGRYEIHELLRQYGQEHLEKMGKLSATKDTHSIFFLRYISERELDIKGRRQIECLQEIAAELENFRAAWNWGLRQANREGINSAIEVVHLYFDMRSRYGEGAFLVEQAKKRFAPSNGFAADIAWARILIRHAFLRVFKLDTREEAQQELAAGLAIAKQYDAKQEIAIGYTAKAAYLYAVQEELETAREYYDRAYLIFRQLDDKFYMARSLMGKGYCSSAMGELERFEEFTEQGLAIAHASSNFASVALAQVNLAEHRLCKGELDKAEKEFRDMINTSEIVGFSAATVYGQALLGLTLMFDGDLAAAEPVIGLALKRSEETSHNVVKAYVFAVEGFRLALVGAYDSSLEWSQTSCDNPGNNTLGLVVAYWGVAIACCGREDWTAGKLALSQALAHAVAITYEFPAAALLPVAVIFATVDDRVDLAVELLGVMENHPLRVTGWVVDWLVWTENKSKLQNILGAERYGAAWKRGRLLAAGIDLETAVALIQQVL